MNLGTKALELLLRKRKNIFFIFLFHLNYFIHLQPQKRGYGPFRLRRPDFQSREDRRNRIKHINTGYGPVRLRRLLWEQETASSNLATPTQQKPRNQMIARLFLFPYFSL